jgi:N-hydroxyarylamine O-acetyltransferase
MTAGTPLDRIPSSGKPSLSDGDVEIYLRHIGHRGPCSADVSTLEALIGAHAATIPFENVDVLAGRVPPLDLASLRDKLLSGRRGGYCFEQNLLFLAVLRALGFDAHPAEARVRADVPPEVITGRTHLVVRVVLDGRTFLADVGFGGMAPLAPVAVDGEPCRCPDGAVYRVVALNGGNSEIALQIQTAHGWQDCYHVGAGTPHKVDLEMGNWFVATFPRSMLGNNLLVARAIEGGRLTLLNRLLTFRRAATDTLEQRELSTRSELEDVLAARFGLLLAEADLDHVIAKLERVAARA